MKKIAYFFMNIFLLICCSPWCNAGEVIVITGKTHIKQPTTYKNVILNLNKGSFYIDSGSLDIEDSEIDITISPDQPNSIFMANGSLILKNNTFKVTTDRITPNPASVSIFDVVRIQQGNLTLINNTADIDKSYTVGFLITDQRFSTEKIEIQDNTFNYFHGGIYIINSNYALVQNNHFNHVSNANVYTQGKRNVISNNIFQFPGNFNVGDSIDIVSSEETRILNNTLLSDSCYGMVVLNSKNILIKGNQIIDGITYGLFIGNNFGESPIDHSIYNSSPQNYSMTGFNNQNITVLNNNFSLNRYGIIAKNVDNLNIIHNYFTQDFSNDKNRQFWTDNTLLLTQITKLQWLNNWYKEGVPQGEANSTYALQFKAFPVAGGVTFDN